ERTGDELTFNIGVESYQMPYTGSLRVALVDGDHEVYQTELSPEMAGKYGGQVPLSGDGPFRLRLIAVDDGEKVAEVVIPGSRARERKATVISELGREMLFSMMPEPEALPVRGGYLSKGDHFASPLTVSEILTDRRTIHATTDVESLSLVVLDLATGRITIQTVGTVHAGEEVTVTAAGPMCTVIAGCFIGDRPFEGYTTFMAPPRLQLEIETAETILPRQELMVRLTCKGANHKVPVLLSIRDQRLTVTDTPHTGLGASLKRAVEVATEGMAERGFTSLADVLDQGPLLEDVVFSADFEAGALSLGSDEVGEYLEDLELAVLEESVGGADEGTTDSGMEEPAREAFPEQLFYGIVPVRGREEVVIPLGDLLGVYTVEAFALASGEWASADTSVIVDQPVRVDMELPPAVHPEDLVTGRLRAATGSGKGTVVLTRDGQNVSLRDTGGREIIAGEDLETPMELEFDLAPGTYLARIEDAASGETDSMQSTVEVPGQFRSYAREMGLLQVGESINLDAADALSLRVIPVVDEPFDALLTTTAGYAHLCCEQTAAKILAAVFMYLTAGSAGVKSKAEEIILAGIARERKMLWPGKGFRMYPDSNYSSDYYGPLAVRYLWYLERLDRVPNISVNLRKVALEGVTMADNAAKSYRMERIPQRLTSMEEAYAAAVNGGDAAEIKAIIESRVDLSQDQARVRNKTHMVADRALLAYTAATLLTLGEWKTGIEIA
ncbi:MAG: hypothetical protein GY731_00080, partial [Gammaproteobacteria bacterium]|nr:hypothetical protein [Gammaproteobacteria bacterium]